jgi:hypothetical protein
VAKSKRTRRKESSGTAARNSRITVSGPADVGASDSSSDPLTTKLIGTDERSATYRSDDRCDRLGRRAHRCRRQASPLSQAARKI